MNAKELPQAIEMEKQLISALFMEEGHVVPDIAAIIDADDLYRVEHRLVFQVIMRLYDKGEPIDYLTVEEELRKSGELAKIDHSYLLGLIEATNPRRLTRQPALIFSLKSSRKKQTCADLLN